MAVGAGRGVLRIDDFCRASGLRLEAVRELHEAGLLAALVDEHGELFGLFDDALPTAAELEAMGVVVDPGYEPERLRSYDDDGDDDPGAASGHPGDGATWSMQWPD